MSMREDIKDCIECAEAENCLEQKKEQESEISCYNSNGCREIKSSKAFISKSQEETNNTVGKINVDLDSEPEVGKLYSSYSVA
jgi:hypothetical protein